MMNAALKPETGRKAKSRFELKKHLNLPLVAGGVILLLIAVVMLFPQWFTSVNPYAGDAMTDAKLQGGVYRVLGAPFPPSKKFLLGSDLVGRDIYSLIIYGTRLTISLGFFVVMARFLVAVPLGVAAGFGNRFCKSVINQFSILFSAIPALIISYIVLNMKYFTSLYKTQSIIAFVIVLTIVGFGKLGQVVDERVTGILARDFINGEKAIGKGSFKIALQNVIPHLSPELAILFFMEFAYALAIIMQLGIFKVFVGNLRIVQDLQAGGIVAAPVSFEPEWASMLGAANTNMMNSPWTLIWPAVAFFISILGLNLFGEGLRKLLQRRDSQFIPSIRRVFTIEKGDLKISNLNPLRGKFRFASILVIAAVLCLGAAKINDRKFAFDSQTYSYAPDHAAVVVGTEEAESTAKYIANELEKYGLAPVLDSLIMPYKNNSRYYCSDSSFLLNGSEASNLEKQRMQPVLGKDFAPGSFYDFKLQGNVYDTTGMDLFYIKDYTRFDNKVVLMDGNVYSTEAMKQIANRIMKNSRATGILARLKKDMQMPKLFGDKEMNYPFVWISDTLGKELTSQNKARTNTVAISVKCRKLSDKGYNVLGVIKGKSEQRNDKVILLGFAYNYTQADKQDGISRIKMALELVRKLTEVKSDRSVMVAFWDGTFSDSGNGAVYSSQNSVLDSEKVDSYIDLTKLNDTSSSSVQFSSELSPISRYFAWSFAHKLKTSLEDNTIVNNYSRIRKASAIIESVPNEDEAMYMYGRMPIIMIANGDNGADSQIKQGDSISIDKIGSILFKTIVNIEY